MRQRKVRTRKSEPIFKSAFTLVELVIVIVVIAILATIIVVSFANVKTEAQVSSVADGLKKVDDAFKLWANENNFNSWPVQNIGGGGTSLQTMINTDPTFQKYLQQIPAVDGVQTQDWFYDNDGDTKTHCGNDYAGVNIVIKYIANPNIGLSVDKLMDDGNTDCGRVRFVDQRIFYSLNYTPTIQDQTW